MLDAWDQSYNRLIPTDEVSWNQMPGSVWCGVAWRVMAWRGVAWRGVPKALLPKGNGHHGYT